MEVSTGGKKHLKTKVPRLQRNQETVISWRCTTDETDVDEDDEDRGVPMVGEENKKKRAQRGVPRKVKLKPLMLYDVNPALTRAVEGGAEALSGSMSENYRDLKDGSRRGDQNLLHTSELNVVKETDRLSFADKRRDKFEPEMKPCSFRQRSVDSHDSCKQEMKDLDLDHVFDATGMDTDLQKLDEVSAGEKAARGSSSDDGRQDSKGTVGIALTSGIPTVRVKVVREADKGPKAAMQIDPKNSPLYDEQDLDASLKILKRIMNMESARPFNTPVDPVVLGIPDYYQVVETPMDFGTIRRLLENREKYLSSPDVYRDIQLIWVNCRKYNHKGDPILEMMKKVQKACSKYWTATGHLRDLKARKAPVDQIMAESRAKEQHSLMQGVKRSYSREKHDLSSCKKDHTFWSTGSEKFVMGKKLKTYNGSRDDALVESSSGEDDESENAVDRQEFEGTKSTSISEKRFFGLGSSISSRRVSGNTHHKDGCSCVVCSGVRRKLAREESQRTDLPQNEGDPNSKKELLNTESRGKPGRRKIHDGQIWCEDGSAEIGNGDGAAEIPENQEDSAHCYPASYQLTPKKINPSIVALGQALFGSSHQSAWSKRHLMVPAPDLSWKSVENPLMAAVSDLCCSVRNKK